jgi:hypothetical protein
MGMLGKKEGAETGRIVTPEARVPPAENQDFSRDFFGRPRG